ncbi:hypothetical protein RB595_008243 [Gaeumannomyces hyphopodioides]
MKFFATAAVLVSAITAVNAFCCGASIGGQCADGTRGTPCCATQSCNIFCCACGGHCRGSGKRSLPDAFRRDADAAFSLADTAGEGKITLPQYLAYMNVDTENTETSQVWKDWFAKHDKNNDGFITADEVSSE